MAERARPSPVPVQSEGRPATVVDAGTVAAPTAGVRRCCVLDVESAPDRFARVLSGRRTAVSRGSPLNEVVNVSYVGFDMAVDGSFSSLTLRSFHRAEYSEVDILGNVQDALAGVADDGGMLATFNGRAFDLPLLRLRQMRWWLCEADAVARIAGGEAEHVDVMLDMSMDDRAVRPSLEDACASLGFSLRGPTAAGRDSPIPRETERCEIDVVGTTILLLHVLATRRRSREPLRRGLPALGRMVRGLAVGRPHLERFAGSAMLREDACAWGAGSA